MSGARDHAAFLASLPAAEKLRLTGRSDRAGLLHLAGHLGLIALTGTGIALRVPGWPLLLPLHGVALSFLFTLAHECTHRTPFASDRLSDIAGTLAGAVLILPFQWFRAFHLAHHRWTNLPGQDPELEGAKPATLRDWLWHVSGLPYWRAQIALLIRLALGREQAPYLPARALPRMRTEARMLLLVYALALASLATSPLVLWLWILPMLLGQPVLRLYLLAEHSDCPPVADMLRNTRTTWTSRTVRFLAWNMPYHAEHHVFPAVPFHRLPELSRHMRGWHGVTAEGYVAFTRAYLDRRRDPRADLRDDQLG